MNKDNYIYGIHAVLALLKSSTKNSVAMIYVAQNRKDSKIKTILSLAQKSNIKIENLSRSELDKLCPNLNHQGVIAKTTKNTDSFSDSKSKQNYTFDDLKNIIEKVKKENRAPFIIILDGVQDPHNLGAVLRSADGVGVDAVIAPKDNAVGLTSAVRKVACGAAETVPFIQVSNLARTIDWLKEENIWSYGFDAASKENLYQIDFNDGAGVALIFGSEGSGMRRLTREHCDFLVQIPMRGTVESLNISVSAGIAMFEVLRQKTKKLKVKN